MTKNENLVKWLLFTALIGLTPIVFAAASGYMFGLPVSLESLLAQGQLFLLAAIVTGSALGELLTTSQLPRVAKLCLGFGCTLVVLLGAYCFAAVALSQHAEPIQPSAIAGLSVGLFLLALVCGALTINAS